MEKNQKRDAACQRQKEETQEKISRFPSDVLGSYTGIAQYGEKPEQDADDL